MSDTAQDLGSARAQVGFDYDGAGMQRFLAEGKQAIAIVAELQRRQQTTASTGQAPSAAQTATKTAQAAKTATEQTISVVDKLRDRIGKADVFERLAATTKTATGQMRRDLEQLQREAEAVQAKLASIGLDRAQLRGVFDAEGAVRDSVIVRADRQTSAERGQRSQYQAGAAGLFGNVRRSADQRFEALFDQADPGTRLAQTGGDITAIKQLADQANTAYQQLDRVEAKVAELLGAGAGKEEALAKPIQAARAALESYDAALAEAQQAEQERSSAARRIDTLVARYQRVNAFEQRNNLDPTSAKGGQADVLRQAIDTNYERAEARKAAATAALTAAQQEQAAAMAVLIRSERELARAEEAEQRKQQATQRTSPSRLDLEATKLATAEEARIAKQIEGETRLAEQRLRNSQAEQAARIAAEQQITQTRLQTEAQVEATRLQALATQAAAEATATAKVEAAREQAAARTATADTQAAAKLEAARLAAQAQAAQADTQAAAKTTEAYLEGAANVTRARLQATAKVEAAEKAAAADIAQAELAANAKVEAERIKAASREQINAERLAARNAASSGHGHGSGQGTTFGSVLTDVAGGLGLYTGVQAVVGGLKQTVVESIQLANSLEDTRATIDGIAGGAEAGAADFRIIQQEARKLGVNIQQTAQAFVPLVAGLRDMPDLFEKSARLAERLALANKAQGLEGATFALNEFLSSGDTKSIADRFNLPAAPFRKLRDDTRDITDLTEQYQKRLEGVNQILQGFGLTEAAVSAATQTNAAAFRQAANDISEAKTALGGYLQIALAPAARGLSAILTSGRANTEVLNAQSAAALAASSSYAEYQAAAEQIAQANEGVISTFNVLTPAQYAYVKALEKTGVAADEAVKKAAELSTLNTLLTSEVPEQGKLLAFLAQFVPGLQQIPDATTGAQAALADLATQLFTLAGSSDAGRAQVEQLVIALRTGKLGPEQFRQAVADLQAATDKESAAAAENARIKANQAAATNQAEEAAKNLADAEKALADRLIQANTEIATAQQRRAQAAAEAEQRHTETLAALAERGKEIERDAQDQRSELAREGAKERAQIEQATAEDLAKAQADYQQRRADLITRQQDQEAEATARFQKEQQAAQEAANLGRLQSQASFIERLYGITRQKGGGGKAAREQAKAELATAKQEADQLRAETGDSDAAAKLLAERQRQILDRLARRQQQAKLGQDARRGSKNLTTGDAQAERAEEQAAQDAADAAQVDAIKNGARRKQQERADEQAKRDQAAKAELAKLDQDAAQAAAKIKEQGQQRLKNQDEQQAARLAQIEKNAAEQRQALQKQLDAEAQQYQQQRDKIARDYQQFLTDLATELQQQANELNLAPDAKRQAQLTELYGKLADALGAEFARRLQTAVQSGVPDSTTDQFDRRAGARPAAGSGSGAASGPRTRTRGSVVGNPQDQVLSDQAIDQIVVGGRQSDGFSSPRGSDLHAGVDLAAPLNTPVKAPIDGEIIGVGSTPTGGNYVKVKGANGDVWYFGHLNRAAVRVGDQVRRGQLVAYSGASGSFNGKPVGPHVHVQLQPGGGRAADPTSALESLATQPSAAREVAAGSPTSQRPRSARSAQSQGFALLTAPGGNPASFAPGTPSRPPVQPVAQQTTTIQQTTIADLRGAQFGAGVSMADVQRATEQGISAALAQRDAAAARAIAELDNAGQLRL